MSGPDDEPLHLRPGASQLLDRSTSVAAMRDILGREYQLLEAALIKGSELLNRVANTVPATSMRDTTADLMWQYLEELDGVDVLLRVGAIGPAEVVGRTLLEIGLQLLYVLQERNELIARAYGVDRRRRNLATLERLVAGSQKKRELLAEARKSWLGDPSVWERHPDTAALAANLKASLAAPFSSTVNAEMDRLRPGANWYSVYGGPPDLLELARRLGMEEWHRMYYAPWSDRVHGRASHKVLFVSPDGSISLNILRDTSEWMPVLVMSHTVTQKVLGEVVSYFSPADARAFAEWCKAGDFVLAKCLRRNGHLPEERKAKDALE